MKCVSPSQVLSLCTLWNKTSPRGSTLQPPQVTPGAVNGQWAETPKWKIWGMSVHGASEKPDILPGAVQGCVCAWAIPGETPISQRCLTPRLCSGGVRLRQRHTLTVRGRSAPAHRPPLGKGQRIHRFTALKETCLTPSQALSLTEQVAQWPCTTKNTHVRE